MILFLLAVSSSLLFAHAHVVESEQKEYYNPIVVPECRYPNADSPNGKLLEYIDEVEQVIGTSSTVEWPADKVKTLAMHFIAVPSIRDNAPPPSADEAMALGAALNSVFKYSGIQFDFSYELMEGSVMPKRFTAASSPFNECKVSQYGDGNCDCHVDDSKPRFPFGPCCRQDPHDGGDCLNQLAREEIRKFCEENQYAERGNGECDSQCNYDFLGYDDGDCCLHEGQWYSQGLTCRDPSSPFYFKNYLDEDDNIGYDEEEVLRWIQEHATHLAGLPALKTILYGSVASGGFAQLASSEQQNFWTGYQLTRFGPGSPLYSLGTLIHEAGHVLSLRHVFNHCGDVNTEHVSSWERGDGLLDTPAVPYGATKCEMKYSFYGDKKACKSDELPARELYLEAVKGKEKALGNWMNYGDCPNSHGHFTKHQAALMRCSADHLHPNVHVKEPSVSTSASWHANVQVVPDTDSWIKPSATSFFDVGDQIEIQFGGSLKDLVGRRGKSKTDVRVALLPLSAARALRMMLDELRPGVNTNMRGWFEPFIIFEGNLEGDSSRLAKLPLKYSDHARTDEESFLRKPFLTKGRYQLVVEDQESGSPRSSLKNVFFSPPFSVGYRTCRSSSTSPTVIGVCRPEKECAQKAWDSPLIDTGSANQCAESLVCCVPKDRSIADDMGNLFHDASHAARQVQFTFEMPSTRLDPLPQAPVNVKATGAFFIGAPVSLSFDISFIRPKLVDATWSKDKVRRRVHETTAYKRGVPFNENYMSTELPQICKTFGIEAWCYGDSTFEVEMVELSLVQFGESSQVELYLLALVDSSAYSRKETFSLSFNLPSDLEEGNYFLVMKMRQQNGSNRKEFTASSAPFQVNLAPCSTESEQPGTCRTSSSCSNPANVGPGCTGFNDDISCCVGDDISVLGYYRFGSLDTAGDGSTPNNSLLALVMGLAGVFFVLILASLALYCFMTRRRNVKTNASKSASSHRRYNSRRLSNRSSQGSKQGSFRKLTSSIPTNSRQGSTRKLTSGRPNSVVVAPSRPNFV